MQTLRRKSLMVEFKSLLSSTPLMVGANFLDVAKMAARGDGEDSDRQPRKGGGISQIYKEIVNRLGSKILENVRRSRLSGGPRPLRDSVDNLKRAREGGSGGGWEIDPLGKDDTPKPYLRYNRTRCQDFGQIRLWLKWRKAP